MTFCLEQTITATSSFGQVAAPVKCKRWTCPNCADWRQRCLMARCIEGEPNRFITWTCRRGQYATELETAQAMVAAWRTVVQRWRRLNPYHKCEYLCVFEPHTSGWPHMHVLWKGHWLDQKWLSQQGAELLNSPNQSVSRIKDGKSAAYYVAKYFSKTPTRYGKLKRYWTSKNWPKLKHIDAGKAFHNGFPIDMVNRKIADIVHEWRRHHKEVWQKPPDIQGWGTLWEPPRKAPSQRHPPRAWRALLGGRPTGGRRALWARPRADHG